MNMSREFNNEHKNSENKQEFDNYIYKKNIIANKNNIIKKNIENNLCFKTKGLTYEQILETHKTQDIKKEYLFDLNNPYNYYMLITSMCPNFDTLNDVIEWKYTTGSIYSLYVNDEKISDIELF